LCYPSAYQYVSGIWLKVRDNSIKGIALYIKSKRNSLAL